MSIAFDQSQTRLNLMRAFAGESQARNRYTFAASLADKQHLHVVASAFRYTADQEKEHAEVFYNLLAGLDGETLHVDGGYPVNVSTSLNDLIKAARHNETEEWETVYPGFARVARDEGFTRIGDTFAAIAEIERGHAVRFGQYIAALEEGTLFRAEEPVAWLCQNCGHIHIGVEAPKACSVCHHDQGYFIRLELSPFRLSL